MKQSTSTTNTPITNNNKKNHTATLPNITTQNKIQYLHGLNNHHESEAIPNSLPHHRNNPKICPNDLVAEQISGTAFTVPRHENKRTWLYRRLPSVKGCSDLFVPVKNSIDSSITTTSSSATNTTSSSSRSSTTYFGHVNWDVDFKLDPNPLRWFPKPIHNDTTNPPPSTTHKLQEEQIQGDMAATRTMKHGTGSTNFIQGTYTMAGSGHPVSKDGIGIHIYTFDCDMRRDITRANDDDGNGSIENSMDVHMYNSDGMLHLFD